MPVTKTGCPEGHDRARRQSPRAESLAQEHATEQCGEHDAVSLMAETGPIGLTLAAQITIAYAAIDTMPPIADRAVSDIEPELIEMAAPHEQGQHQSGNQRAHDRPVGAAVV